MKETEPYTPADSLRGVLAGIDACITLCREPGRPGPSVPEVSAWSVQDHVEHMLLADREILRWAAEALTRPNPQDRADSPNDIGARVLGGGSIPRGRGPAPEFAMPVEMETAALVAELEDLRELAAGLASHAEALRECRHTLPHHVLGHFTPAEWLRFLHIHHAHHDAIIRDILIAAS